MKTQLIAALLFSTALIAGPAVANGNANLGNDTSAWAGPSTLTRAQVREQLIESQQANRYAHTSDISYPVLPDTGTEGAKPLTTYSDSTYPAPRSN